MLSGASIHIPFYLRICSNIQSCLAYRLSYILFVVSSIQYIIHIIPLFFLHIEKKKHDSCLFSKMCLKFYKMCLNSLTCATHNMTLHAFVSYTPK